MTRIARKPAVVPHGTVLPPPRPGVRHVRVVRIGIVIADDRVRRRIDRLFHRPMIILALLVLPLLAIEFFVNPVRPSLAWWLWISAMTVIWLAFLIEFMIKIAIAECRIEYCKRNWLDVIIILMPALRLLRIATLAKTTRAFTLRGVGMKFARYVFTLVIGLEASDRLLRRLGLKSDDERPDPEQMTRLALQDEVRKLRSENDAWQAWYHDHTEHIEIYALEPLPTEPSAVTDGDPLQPGDRTTISDSCESPSPS